MDLDGVEADRETALQSSFTEPLERKPSSMTRLVLRAISYVGPSIA